MKVGDAEMESVAVQVPCAIGEKANLTVQSAAGVSMAPVQLSLDMLKSVA